MRSNNEDPGTVRAAAVRAPSSVSAEAGTVQGIIERGRQRGIIDGRPAAELFGWDEVGLPS